ncbi:hypothetical protein [Nocardioides sp. CER19]|uniref:MmcQ/YjbR family DNA-binding protein n=1 Tax=Nocardioides sp. CER19 TaxID=3038538 RepID=UPI0024499C1E|nr:hypothetical protein [Nocardioides sp. CER19]MDH2414891.1 hypothetical protein [Nocardioides sp. CER19]
MARDPARPAQVADVHELALGMPHVTIYPGTQGRPVYQVGGRSFVFFRNPRPDAVDPGTGQRYDDVIVFWVPDEGDKLAMVQDESSPFFTTSHFDGHLSVLLRASRVGEISYGELAEVVQDAWLSRASARRRETWLREHRDATVSPVSFDVFFQRFQDGRAAPGGGEAMRRALEPYIVQEDPEHRFAFVEYGDGSADVYLDDDSMMVNHVVGEKPWELLVEGARAAGWVIMPTDGPTCVTDEAQRPHLPEDLAGQVVLVGSGVDLVRVIRAL